MTFESFAAALLDGLEAAPSSRPDAAVLEREVQLACTHAMLVCLDRDHRMAFILGDVFDLDSNTAAEICDVTPATHRKRLSRARSRVRGFVSEHCGLVNADAACRCARRVEAAIDAGRIDPKRLDFTTTAATPRHGDANDQMSYLYDAAQLWKSLPQPVASTTTTDAVIAMIRRSSLVDDV